MKLTVKHYYFLGNKSKDVNGNLISSTSWDAVRIDDENGNKSPFSIPGNREEWVKKCLNHEPMAKRAEAINNFINKNNFKKVISLGAGACFMEYNLKAQNPSIYLECSDFSPQSIARLGEVFLEANKIEVVDLLKEEFKNVDKEALYLLHRIDTDFNDKQWQDIFMRMNKAGINNILFVPCDISTPWSLLKEQLSCLYQIVFRGSKLSFVGYLRTRDRFISLFEKFYNLSQEFQVADLIGFYLKKK